VRRIVVDSELFKGKWRGNFQKYRWSISYFFVLCSVYRSRYQTLKVWKVFPKRTGIF